MGVWTVEDIFSSLPLLSDKLFEPPPALSPPGTLLFPPFLPREFLLLWSALSLPCAGFCFLELPDVGDGEGVTPLGVLLAEEDSRSGVRASFYKVVQCSANRYIRLQHQRKEQCSSCYSCNAYFEGAGGMILISIQPA